MARRGKKADSQLIVALLVAAPFIWLFQKVGSSAIILLVALIVIILVVNSARKKKRPTKSTRSRRNKNTATIPADNVDNVLAALDRMDMKDYLGMAAEAGHKAKSALDGGDFDTAWRCYHDQKNHYLNHAKRSGFTGTQTIALDGSVNRSLANVLRIQGRNTLALTHFLYYYASSTKITKTDEKQLQAYFNRAKITTLNLDEVRSFVKRQSPRPDFRAIQAACNQWGDAA